MTQPLLRFCEKGDSVAKPRNRVRDGRYDRGFSGITLHIRSMTNFSKSPGNYHTAY
jgi:hypothetical protein